MKLSNLKGLQALVDVEGFPDPLIITGDEQRPNFALVKGDIYHY